MGASTREKGVLKLVHPGRHVEYHKMPIMAADIMRKNPRHSITRTDFFKNPYIVVNPKSVLVPGQVFYIVPNKTVYRLLKDKGQQIEKSNNIDRKTSKVSSVNYGSDDSLSFLARDYYLNRSGSALAITNKDDHQKSLIQVMEFKSCMKKEGSIRASFNLRVTFDFSTMIRSQMEEIWKP